jgi:hypothetical protein
MITSTTLVDAEEGKGNALRLLKQLIEGLEGGKLAVSYQSAIYTAKKEELGYVEVLSGEIEVKLKLVVTDKAGALGFSVGGPIVE